MSAQTGSAAAVLVSPLLNLAPASAGGATLKQSRPLVPLGNSGLRGTAMLSLAPDRRSIEVKVQLDCATPASLRLRRLAGRDLGDEGSQDDLLIVEIFAVQPSFEQPCTKRSFSLGNRDSCVPFGRVSDLRKAGICLSELRASSIEGVRAEPASAAEPASRGTRYAAERMRVEIEAAKRSASAIAACRHVELANLYARQLRDLRSAPVRSDLRTRLE
jgi:hypothetical protein